MVYNGYMAASTYRRIMRQHLGRKLLKTEVVHHVNGNSADNRIENLMVLTHKEHGQIHKQSNKFFQWRRNSAYEYYRATRDNALKDIRWVHLSHLDLSEICQTPPRR